jgi:hypothetical protein
MRRGIVDYKFSCITGSVFGSAKRKVIYTTGAGARLVNETPVDMPRHQQPRLAEQSVINFHIIAWPAGDQSKNIKYSHINTLSYGHL